MTSSNDRRQQVMVGDLPTDFLRVGETSDITQRQIAADAQAAQALQFQMSGGSPFAARTMPRLSITVSQAKLTKNYGLVKMDPYCRMRVGHSVFETHTSNNGGKNPRWGKIIHCYIPQGVESIYIEIFDEKAFTMDDRVAWTHIQIPERVMTGDTIDEWFPLTGKQGDNKEGMINLIFSYNQQAVVPQPAAQTVSYGGAPIMIVPGGMPAYYPPAGQPVQYPAGQVPQQPQATQPPQQQQQPQGPLYTEEDVKQVKDMFPNVDEEVIKSVLEANRGNKDATINNLLSMES